MFGSKNDKHKPQVSGDNITLIGPSCEVSGNIETKSSIKVDGTTLGNIKAADTVIVAQNGVIKGDVNAKELIVYGKVEGNIFTETLHLQPTARIQGEINTKNLEIESGAIYQGAVNMRQDAAGKPLEHQPKLVKNPATSN